MKTQLSVLAAISAGALLMACNSDQTKNESNDFQSRLDAASAVVHEADIQPEPLLAALPELEVPLEPEVKRVRPVTYSTGSCLSKHDGTMYISTTDGLYASSGKSATCAIADNTVASLVYGDQHWVLQDDLLRSFDGSVQITPDFGSALTALAGHNGEVFVGTSGEGVWQMVNGTLEPVSTDWEVISLTATDFGLFAATRDGLFSYDGDRWHRRRLNASSTALDDVTSLYYRYPYLYVGTESELLTYDGGEWTCFVFGSAVTAMGWHNARLYVGTGDGGLLTLEGTVLEQVASPGAGDITSILRFQKRLHVTTPEGLFRYRHGRFEKIELEESTQREPETEPIASLQ